MRTEFVNRALLCPEVKTKDKDAEQMHPLTGRFSLLTLPVRYIERTVHRGTVSMYQFNSTLLLGEDFILN